MVWEHGNSGKNEQWKKGPWLFRVFGWWNPTQWYRDYDKPLQGSRWNNQDSKESKGPRDFFFVAEMVGEFNKKWLFSLGPRNHDLHDLNHTAYNDYPVTTWGSDQGRQGWCIFLLNEELLRTPEPSKSQGRWKIFQVKISWWFLTPMGTCGLPLVLCKVLTWWRVGVLKTMIPQRFCYWDEILTVKHHQIWAVIISPWLVWL